MDLPPAHALEDHPSVLDSDNEEATPLLTAAARKDANLSTPALLREEVSPQLSPASSEREQNRSALTTPNLGNSSAPSILSPSIQTDAVFEEAAVRLQDEDEQIIPIFDINRSRAADVPRIIVDVIPDDNDESTSCCMRLRPFRPALYALPVMTALGEAADVGRSLYTTNTKSIPIIATAGVAAFFASIGLTGETTKKNFDLTCDMVKTRSLPHDWPKLTRRKEIAALCIDAIPLSWGVFAKSMEAYYFIEALPEEYGFSANISRLGWKIGSGIISGGTGITYFLTNGTEMYKLTRDRFAGVSTPYSNGFSKFASPILGGTLGVLNAAQDSMQSFIAMKSILGAESVHARLLLGVPSALNMVPSFCFDGMFSINAMDEFLGYIPKRLFEPKKILAFSMSATLAVYLAFLKRGLNLSFYNDVTTDFGLDPKNIPNEVFEALSWSMFVQESIQATATLYGPMYGLVDRVSNKLYDAGAYVARCICPAPAPERDPELGLPAPPPSDEPHLSAENAARSPSSERTPLLGGHQPTNYSAPASRLFPPAPRENDAEEMPRPPAPKKRVDQGCGIM